MELRHLIYFEAVARHQHVSRAAEELAIAQPAITKQLHDLERELGAGPLFERVGRSLRLTEGGRSLLLHARGILSQVEALRAEMRERGGLEHGRVTIGAPPTVGERLLPEVLAAFHRCYPKLEICMHEGSSQTLIERLITGEIDIAVVTQPLMPCRLQVRPLFSEDLVVVTAQDHPLADREVITFADLAAESFLLYSPGGFVREATLAACKQAGFVPRVVLDGGAVEMLLRLAEAGLGIAIIPPLALTGRECLAVRRLSAPTLRRTMVLVTREGRALAPATHALLAFLESRLRQKPNEEEKQHGLG